MRVRLQDTRFRIVFGCPKTCQGRCKQPTRLIQAAALAVPRYVYMFNVLQDREDLWSFAVCTFARSVRSGVVWSVQ